MNETSQGFLDRTIWKSLNDAETLGEFCPQWLALQCGLVDGVVGGVLVLGPPDDGPYSPIAFWPDRDATSETLMATVDEVLKNRKGIAKQVGDGDSVLLHVGYPIRIKEQLHGAVVLGVTHRSQDRLQLVMRHLQWGTAFLEKELLLRDSEQSHFVKEQSETVLDLTAGILEEPRFQKSAMMLATGIADRFECDRVSLGFVHGKQIKVCAMSHSAQFSKQMNLIRRIGKAMEESIDQGMTLVFPSPEGASPLMLREQGELSKQHDSLVVCTIPFLNKDGVGYGAVTLERSTANPFDNKTMMLCESVVTMAAPILQEKKQNDRLIITKIGESFRTQVGTIVGPAHLLKKTVLVVLVGLVIFFSFATGDYRITTETVIEGSVQRAIVAPYSGYIDEAIVRAGDVVQEGQVMSRLDVKDMLLERIRLSSQREQLRKQSREAMANGERARVNVIEEQINQVNAQIELIDEQTARAEIRAPFAGIVVSGDLSQSLGAPVERGSVLFEVAPLDEYRVILEVDERDIRQLKLEQTGDLILTALSEEKWPIQIVKITPVTRVQEGRSFFRVEAELKTNATDLRPGMEGFSKIHIGRRKLIWIWTHDLIDWVRVKVWAFWP